MWCKHSSLYPSANVKGCEVYVENRSQPLWIGGVSTGRSALSLPRCFLVMAGWGTKNSPLPCHCMKNVEANTLILVFSKLNFFWIKIHNCEYFLWSVLKPYIWAASNHNSSASKHFPANEMDLCVCNNCFRDLNSCINCTPAVVFLDQTKLTQIVTFSKNSRCTEQG